MALASFERMKPSLVVLAFLLLFLTKPAQAQWSEKEQPE